MRLIVAVVLGAASAVACGDVSSRDCGDGTFCPVNTECESGRCVANQDACADFSDNTPCRLGDDRGFCASGECVAGVTIRGRVVDFQQDVVIGVTVEALERPWMDPDTIEIGTFELLSLAFDSDLVLRFDSASRLEMQTRRLVLSDAPYVINDDENVPLQMIGQGLHQKFVRVDLGETYEPGNGLVLAKVLRPDRDKLGEASIRLVGDSPSTPLYFVMGRTPDPAATQTSTGADGSSIVLFPNTAPGTYEVEIDHPVATECRATGDLAPAPIIVDVIGSTLTHVGDIICRPPP